MTYQEPSVMPNDATGNSRGKHRLRQYLKLVFCCSLVLIFMFVVGPWIEKVPMVKPLVTFIEERDIDAGALYYTEIEEFSEADINMTNSMKYPPK